MTAARPTAAESVADDVTIENLVKSVSDQLLRSQRDRLAAGEPAVFEVSELTLEISFIVTQSTHGSAGFDLKVVKADAGLKYDSQSVHKISLKLAAVQDQAQPFGGFGPVRPRRTDVESDRGG